MCLMVGFGNRYPEQLLRSAIHAVTRANREVVNADYDDCIGNQDLAQNLQSERDIFFLNAIQGVRLAVSLDAIG